MRFVDFQVMTSFVGKRPLEERGRCILGDYIGTCMPEMQTGRHVGSQRYGESRFHV